MKIGFIGLGNMAGAIIGGLIKKGEFAAADICGADVNAAMAAKRRASVGVTVPSTDGICAAFFIILLVQFSGTPQYSDPEPSRNPVFRQSRPRLLRSM